MLVLLAVAHCFKSFRPYLLDSTGTTAADEQQPAVIPSEAFAKASPGALAQYDFGAQFDVDDRAVMTALSAATTSVHWSTSTPLGRSVCTVTACTNVVSAEASPSLSPWGFCRVYGHFRA